MCLVRTFEDEAAVQLVRASAVDRCCLVQQLKVIQEVITLVVFVGFSSIAFKGESFKWNHALAFLFLVAAVYLVFKK